VLDDLLDSSQVEELTDTAIEQFYTYGYAQYKFGNFLQAIDVFRSLCTRRPFESRFWFGLGAACQEMKQYEAAIQSWMMAARTEPNDPYPHFHAAECALSKSDWNRAFGLLKEAEARVAKHHPLKEQIVALKLRWKTYESR